jgi:uncharacterized protein
LERITASNPLRGRFRRLAVIIVGWTFIALGIAGLFLPFLQGILFILIGLVILSKEHHWAAKVVVWLRSRFPKLDKWFAWAHRKVERIFGARGDIPAARN